MAQTKREIETLLAAAGVRPRKRFGQHFLIDGNLMRKLAAAAEPRPDDVVLEVGPGTGSLTEELLERAGHVVAVEIDRDLAAMCRERFAGTGKLTLLEGDVLANKATIDPAVCHALLDRRRTLGGRMLLVANLPYDIATPLIADLLLGPLPMAVMCFTVQAEVADRFLASAGGRSYGPISVLVQALGRLRCIARVPATAFWPSPKVASAMLRFDRATAAGVAPADLPCLAELLHGCFRHRRKTMRRCLRPLVEAPCLAAIAADGRWDLDLRPEQLAVADWTALAAFRCDWSGRVTARANPR